MTVTKTQCDAVRDIALKAVGLSESLCLGAHSPTSYADDVYTPEERSFLINCAIEADQILKEWQAAWTDKVCEWFELNNPGKVHGDYLTACQWGTRCAVVAAKMIAAMLTDGYSTIEDIRRFATGSAVSAAEIRAEWVNAVKSLPAVTWSKRRSPTEWEWIYEHLDQTAISWKSITRLKLSRSPDSTSKLVAFDVSQLPQGYSDSLTRPK